VQFLGALQDRYRTRAILAGAACIPAGVPAVANTGADAELLALGAQLESVAVDLLAVNTPRGRSDEEVDREVDDVFERLSPLAENILLCKAETIAGFGGAGTGRDINRSRVVGWLLGTK
jgi:hypothetical protein